MGATGEWVPGLPAAPRNDEGLSSRGRAAEPGTHPRAPPWARRRVGSGFACGAPERQGACHPGAAQRNPGPTPGLPDGHGGRVGSGFVFGAPERRGACHPGAAQRNPGPTPGLPMGTTASGFRVRLRRPGMTGGLSSRGRAAEPGTHPRAPRWARLASGFRVRLRRPGKTGGLSSRGRAAEPGTHPRAPRWPRLASGFRVRLRRPGMTGAAPIGRRRRCRPPRGQGRAGAGAGGSDAARRPADRSPARPAPACRRRRSAAARGATPGGRPGRRG